MNMNYESGNFDHCYDTVKSEVSFMVITFSILSSHHKEKKIITIYDNGC